jgi:hypothetical protein
MRQYPGFSLRASASESRPRELTRAELVAMTGIHASDARPVQNPPTGSTVATSETSGDQSRPSDALLAEHAGITIPGFPSSGPRESRG